MSVVSTVQHRVCVAQPGGFAKNECDSDDIKQRKAIIAADVDVDSETNDIERSTFLK